MEDKKDRLKWFEANLEDKHPGLTLAELSQSFRLDPEVFQSNVINGVEYDSMAGSVLKGFLGCTLNEFVEGGKAICAQGGQPGASASASNASGGLDGLLNDARLILEKGGDKAQALRTIISLMKGFR